MMYCCILERTNAEPPCTGMYWYIPFVLVHTVKYRFWNILACTGMYFSRKVHTCMFRYVLFSESTLVHIDLYPSIVQVGTYYIPVLPGPVHTDFHQV
jgi:hypothetical protein